MKWKSFWNVLQAEERWRSIFCCALFSYFLTDSYDVTIHWNNSNKWYIAQDPGPSTIAFARSGGILKTIYNLCKQFGSRRGKTKRGASSEINIVWIGFTLFWLSQTYNFHWTVIKCTIKMPLLCNYFWKIKIFTE